MHRGDIVLLAGHESARRGSLAILEFIISKNLFGHCKWDDYGWVRHSHKDLGWPWRSRFIPMLLPCFLPRWSPQLGMERTLFSGWIIGYMGNPFLIWCLLWSSLYLGELLIIRQWKDSLAYNGLMTLEEPYQVRLLWVYSHLGHSTGISLICGSWWLSKMDTVGFGKLLLQIGIYKILRGDITFWADR